MLHIYIVVKNKCIIKTITLKLNYRKLELVWKNVYFNLKMACFEV